MPPYTPRFHICAIHLADAAADGPVRVNPALAEYGFLACDPMGRLMTPTPPGYLRSMRASCRVGLAVVTITSGMLKAPVLSVGTVVME